MTQGVFVRASNPLPWDFRSCEEWLGRAALSDAAQACRTFITLLEELENAPPRPAPFLQILERLREPIIVAQAGQMKGYAGKPLPLGQAENAAFTRSCDLWTALLHAYRGLLHAEMRSASTDGAPTAALLLVRSIQCAAELIDACLAARNKVPDDLWRGLHETYAIAQSRALADVPVPDSGARAPAESSCTAAYVRPLLHALANPYGQQPRELAWTRRWTHHWAHKLRIVPATGQGGAWVVDLQGCEPARWASAGPETGSLRFIDVGDLLRSLRRRLRKIGEGVAPAELGLGRDCTEPATGRLLGELFAAWGEPPRARQFPRRASASAAMLVSGFPDIHAAIGGRFLPDERHPWDYGRREAENIHVFQRSLRTAASMPRQPAIEQWQTLDESANGFRLQRTGPGVRIAHRQLIALRPHGARHYILCEVRWLAQAADQSIEIGAKALPGLAHAVDVRVDGAGPARKAPFTQAFMLPIAAGHPQTVVLPAGMHQNARVLELRLEGQLLRIRLTVALGSGWDYDRAEFEMEA